MFWVVSSFLLFFKSDFLSYDNALAYTYFTYIDKVLDGNPHPDNMTKVKIHKYPKVQPQIAHAEENVIMHVSSNALSKWCFLKEIPGKQIPVSHIQPQTYDSPSLEVK